MKIPNRDYHLDVGDLSDIEKWNAPLAGVAAIFATTRIRRRCTEPILGQVVILTGSWTILE